MCFLADEKFGSINVVVICEQTIRQIICWYSRGSTTVTEVKLHYFRGHGSTTAMEVKNFSSISE